MNDESCQGIQFSNVMGLIPEQLAVIVRSSTTPWAKKICMEKESFMRFKFQAIKWIRKRELPEDRCWYFETLNKNGCWSFEKQEKLIESRKTRKEKAQEKKEERELMALFKKHNIGD